MNARRVGKRRAEWAAELQFPSCAATQEWSETRTEPYHAALRALAQPQSDLTQKQLIAWP